MSNVRTERHYKLTLSDGSVYYGRTTLSGNKRYVNHRCNAKKGKHNKHIQEVYNKYGYDDWVWEWLGEETGDLEHHRKIEFGYVQVDPKAINLYNGRFASGENEYFKQKQQTIRDAHTPEEREEYNRKYREIYQKRKQKIV